jgi:hypothetical protein
VRHRRRPDTSSCGAEKRLRRGNPQLGALQSRLQISRVSAFVLRNDSATVRSDLGFANTSSLIASTILIVDCIMAPEAP